jgi:cytochrome c oxidase assembly protein subunit 15
MNFADGFTVWRALGVDALGNPLPFSALTAIHYVHRLSAYLVFIGIGLLVWKLLQVKSLRSAAKWLAMLALWQFATGLSNVILDWPLLAAVAHTGGAAGLVIVLTGVWAAAPVHAQSTVPTVSSQRLHA